MESNFMKDLYYGRIQPSERQFPNSKETAKAAKDVQSAKGNLIHHLTPMQKSLLDTYIEKESILAQQPPFFRRSRLQKVPPSGWACS